MATYKIDSSLLTAQADEIRTLNGTTAMMNPSQMTTALQSANAEVAAQEQKIIEITEMLQGKAMGGSGAGSEACTVEVRDPGLLCYYIYEQTDGNVECKDWTVVEANGGGYDDFFNTDIHNVPKGSLFTFITADYLDIESCILTNVEVSLHSKFENLGGDILVVRIMGNATVSLEY